MEKRRLTKCFLIILALLAGIATLFIVAQKRNLTHEEVTMDKEFELAPLRTDCEPISSRIPWLKIQSCEWKAVVMGASEIPGPSEVLVCGYIGVSADYFELLAQQYEWKKSNVPVHVVPEGLSEDELNLKVSSSYKEYFSPLQKKASIQVYVDFNNKLLYFSGRFDSLDDERDSSLD